MITQMTPVNPPPRSATHVTDATHDESAAAAAAGSSLDALPRAIADIETLDELLSEPPASSSRR